MRDLVLRYIFSLSCPGASLLGIEARGAQYLARGASYSLSVYSHSAVLSLSGHSVTMSVAGQNANSLLEPLGHMAGRANYLIGNNIRASYGLYGSVEWRGIIPSSMWSFTPIRRNWNTIFQIAAPILLAGAQEIELIAPFELAGKTRTSVQVQYLRRKSNPVEIAVGAGRAADSWRFQPGFHNEHAIQSCSGGFSHGPLPIASPRARRPSSSTAPHTDWRPASSRSTSSRPKRRQPWNWSRLTATKPPASPCLVST
ncbi:MAG TPA: hypothetical protein VMB03_05520 [Bryobacteraceae bacterium]|nr:hypothetical protein [Bryobacteraceae bacterium]